MSVCKERAWENLKKFSFERVTGTDEEKRSAEMLKAVCDEAGVDCVIEEFEIKTPTITEVSFAITKPEYKEFHCIGVAATGCTPDEGIVAPFIYLDGGLPNAIPNARGKIALISGRVMPDMMKQLKEAGVLGVVQIHGSFYDAPELVKELRPRGARGEDVIPSVVLHVTDAEALVNARPEEVKMIVKGDKDAVSTSRNVVATIEGSDEVLKNEILLFSAHYDSVPYSPGAWDNMTGSITIMELMYHYLENKPKRTVKFVWCGAEEIGGRGSGAYCEAHKDQLKDIIYNINFDMTGVTLGYEHFCCSASDQIFHFTTTLAKLENYWVDAKIGMYSSDSSEFALCDVPSCTFARLASNGGKTFHNRYDTMDHLDPDSFMITLNFVVKYADIIVNAPVNIVDRQFSKELEPQLKMWKERAKKMK